MTVISPKTILVVEDVSNIRDLLDVTLRFKGYTVRTAKDGEEALRLIAEELPALVISDILMPRLDGFSLVQRLRVQEITRDIPVIMISATYVSAEDRAFALRLGAIEFLEKPVDTEVFLRTVETSLRSAPKALPDPLADEEFYAGYVHRLEIKLAQKESQIARTERLIRSLDDEQRPAFEAILEEEMRFRTAIMQELSAVKARVLEMNPSNLSRRKE